jgi:hypothetical protein
MPLPWTFLILTTQRFAHILGAHAGSETRSHVPTCSSRAPPLRYCKVGAVILAGEAAGMRRWLSAVLTALYYMHPRSCTARLGIEIVHEGWRAHPHTDTPSLGT